MSRILHGITAVISPKQSVEGTTGHRIWVKGTLPLVFCDRSCILRDHWLPTQWEKSNLLKNTWKSALLPQSCLWQSEQTKNTFRKKWGLLVLTTRVTENWMEKSSLQLCDTFLASTATKNTSTPLSFNIMKMCQNCSGQLHLYLFFTFFKVCLLEC